MIDEEEQTGAEERVEAADKKEEDNYAAEGDEQSEVDRRDGRSNL